MAQGLGHLSKNPKTSLHTFFAVSFSEFLNTPKRIENFRIGSEKKQCLALSRRMSLNATRLDPIQSEKRLLIQHSPFWLSLEFSTRRDVITIQSQNEAKTMKLPAPFIVLGFLAGWRSTPISMRIVQGNGWLPVHGLRRLNKCQRNPSKWSPNEEEKASQFENDHWRIASRTCNAVRPSGWEGVWRKSARVFDRHISVLGGPESVDGARNWPNKNRGWT